MRILALTWKHPLDHTAGGAERYLVEVCRRWVSAGHEVTIFGPRLPAHLGFAEDKLGLPYVAKKSRLGVFNAARRYLRANGHLYDRILETVSTRPFAAHRIVGNKAVALYHQTAEDVWQQEFPLPLALAARYVLEPSWIRGMRTARVVANSPSTAASLARFGVASLGIVPPGCDPQSAESARVGPHQPPKVLWIGRLVRTKRPMDALLAFELIRRRMPGATLDVVGSGYLEAGLRSRARAGATVHGYLKEPDKARLLAAADILLLPGTREGWGIVAMEAAANGVPVVAYDIPGLRDAVVDGVTGVLVPRTPGALGEAAVQILENEQVWRMQSTAGIVWASSHTWDDVADRLLAVLRGGEPRGVADGTEVVVARSTVSRCHSGSPAPGPSQ